VVVDYKHIVDLQRIDLSKLGNAALWRYWKHFNLVMQIFNGKGSLDNGYLDNLDNGFSNKYEKNLKNIKEPYGYVHLFID
jgi:5-methylcytosine-specific restriction endonuclease McrA